MVLTSPRASARNLQSVPQDWSDEREHLRLVSNAARQLQERSLRHPIEVVAQSANYTMTDDDLAILINATGGNKTVTLLTAASRKGRRVIVQKTDSSSNTVTIDAAGSETLDGATTVVLSTQYSSREFASDGTNWFGISGGTAAAIVDVITFVIDGGGAAITTGVKRDVHIPYACTITSVTMLADQSGSIVVDLWKDTYANYPPTVADTITASAKPTISTATKSQDTTLTGWTTTVAAGSIIRPNVDSCTSIQAVLITLTVTRT